MGDPLKKVINKDDMNEIAKPDIDEMAKVIAYDERSSESSQGLREISPKTTELSTRRPEASSIIETINIQGSTEGIVSTRNEADLNIPKESFIKLIPEKRESIHKDSAAKPCNTEVTESADCVIITLKASHRQKIPKLRTLTTKSVPETSKSSAQVPKINPEDLVLTSENESCHDNQNKQSSTIRPYSKFDIQINSKFTSDREQFIQTISSVNSDMVEKKRKLLQKQTFVSEMVSYIQATQSVCRLLLPRNRFVDHMSTDEKRTFDFSSNENFHSIGEGILEKLLLYLDGLKADFKDWDAKRTTISGISENIPKQLELCNSEYSSRVLMHEISTGISSILQEMNDITTKIEERNSEFTEIWEGIDGYIMFSSSFIVGKSL